MGAEVQENIDGIVRFNGVVWSSVPIVRDPFLALQPFEATWVARNAKELLELVTIEISCGVLFGVVAHEVDDKVVPSVAESVYCEY